MKHLLSAAAIGLLSSSVVAEDHSNHKHHEHSGSSGSAYHQHGEGEWMFTYRYMRMEMDGMRDGTDDLSTADVLTDYMVAPTEMTMEMHMFGAMYGVSDDVTIMAMLPYLKNEMDHITRMGVEFTTRSKGIGDVKLVGIYNLNKENSSRLQFKAGISIPTGDIDSTDDTPAMANAQLPYPMQLGSGSWEFLPGLIYNNSKENFDWGAEASAVIRLNDNDNDYRLGNRLDISGWASKPFNQMVSGTLKVKGLVWDSIDGADPDLNPMMVPTADPDNFGGKRIDMSAGITVSPVGALSGQTFGVELIKPVYEDLDGPQMSVDWSVMASWQLSL